MKLYSKFNLGDVVYIGRSTVDTKLVVCPTCEGGAHISAKTQDGRDIRVDCPDCRSMGLSDYGRKKISVVRPYVNRLTVGQIRIEYCQEAQRTQYMCRETGVGSGGLWDEDQMSRTPEAAWEEALGASQRQADHINEYNGRQKRKRGSSPLVPIEVDPTPHASSDWRPEAVA